MRDDLQTPTGAPRISVVIACYDLGLFLDEAVASVLAQTLQDFEIIIVDDGSTDAATCDLLADYRRPRTRVVRAPHRGLAAARNLGMAQSTGIYICALDADDRLAPSYLEKAASTLDADPSVTFVSAWLRTFGTEEWDWTPERCDLQTLLRENTVLTAALVRRAAVEAAGGYDEQMPVQGDEDWDLWLTLVERGARGVILPEILFEYRRRPNSMSTICWNGPGHVPLAHYRIARHRDAYERHLFDVLMRQDVETAEILRENDALERYLGSELEPAVARQHDEVCALRKRLTGAASSIDLETTNAELHHRLETLQDALRSSSHEVAALRTSKSWLITRPLRSVYDWWLRWRPTA